MRTISATTWEALAAQQTGVVFIVLLELTHASMAEPIRASADTTESLSSGLLGTISNSVEYPFFPFGMVMPNQTDDTPPKARLTIDNIDRSVVAAIRDATGDPIRVSIQIVTDADKDTSLIGELEFDLVNTRYDATSVSGDLSYEGIMDEPYPEGVFGPSDFPGLF